MRPISVEIRFDSESRSEYIEDILYLAMKYGANYEEKICKVVFEYPGDHNITQLLKFVKKLKDSQIFINGRQTGTKNILKTLKYQEKLRSIISEDKYIQFLISLRADIRVIFGLIDTSSIRYILHPKEAMDARGIDFGVKIGIIKSIDDSINSPDVVFYLKDDVLIYGWTIFMPSLNGRWDPTFYPLEGDPLPVPTILVLINEQKNTREIILPAVNHRGLLLKPIHEAFKRLRASEGFPYLYYEEEEFFHFHDYDADLLEAMDEDRYATTCPLCFGKGVVTTYLTTSKCPLCNGSGRSS